MQTDNLTVKNSGYNNMTIGDNSVLRFFNSKVESDNESNLRIFGGSRVILKNSNIIHTNGNSVDIWDRGFIQVMQTNNSFTGKIDCWNPVNMGVSIVKNDTGSAWDNASSPTDCPVH